VDTLNHTITPSLEGLVKKQRRSDLKQFLEIVSETQKVSKQENTEDALKYNANPRPSWVPWFKGEPNAAVPAPLCLKPYRPDIALDSLLDTEHELRLGFRRCGVQLVQMRTGRC
jgi:hypothetical protein